MDNRCNWNTEDEMYLAYHDEEWGVPVHDDRLLFEFLILEGAQAGLSWLTILRKRAEYKKAYDNFEIETVANYTESDVERLLSNSGIVRNKLKVRSSITNAKAVLEIQREFGSFSNYLWNFVDGKTVDNHLSSISDMPITSDISDKMSKDMKRRGLKFVGSTIMYSFMQAVGMVNDHITTCFRYEEVKHLSL
ncbi:MAG: DNA-3-methyladenine glycosylase I [Sphaerochaetaceae bacterium]|nr:DNA-3-methyladenine glycosylase I [Sphaerochaetaceae bacterium]